MHRVLVHLKFPPEATDKPVIAGLVKKYGIVFNILGAEVAPGKLGRMTLEISGTEDNVDSALEELSQIVEVTRFSKSALWNAEKCVHCGACTAVCPSDALHMDTKTWELSFDRGKCIACKLCIQSCPLGAMDMDLFI